MSTPLLLELFAGFLAAGFALWFVVLSRGTTPPALIAEPLPGSQLPASPRKISSAIARLIEAARPWLVSGVLAPGLLASTGLLLLRLAIGVMMIHHGQEKLADPQQFANTYVASLHLPFPLFFAYAAGLSELIGSWLLIFGVFTPLGALAITGTMTVAGYQHILTAGLNIYVLELVVLYLGGSIALLLLGPGRFSLDRLLAGFLLKPGLGTSADPAAEPDAAALIPALVPVEREDGRRR